MAPDLEDYLWSQLHLAGQDGRKPREVISGMLDDGRIASPKQAWATLQKWSDRNWYDYGVTLDLGWKTIEQRPNRVAAPADTEE